MAKEPYQRFLEVFSDSGEAARPGAGGQLADLLTGLGGQTFGGGLYRVHTHETSRDFTAVAVEGFSNLGPVFQCFGYDWLGRQFALPLSTTRDRPEFVLMLEPGTGQALEIPHGLRAFHDQALVENRDACLADGFFASWLSQGGRSPDLSECVGYKITLLLGGKDEAENLEITDLEVYWTLSMQLLAAVGTLPPGTTIPGAPIS
jgi:hypothetical protein